ncbi:MAG TPA: hypothetical protein VFN13_04380 [Rudaea sp.]|nr:hypothetical protein [Rudaea sp.]
MRIPPVWAFACACATQSAGVHARAIVSANHSQALRDHMAAAGCQLLHKPVKSLALKSLLAHLVARVEVDSAPV